MKTLLVVCGVVLCVVGVALCKRETFCGRLVREAKETLYHNLPVANNLSELVVHRCVTRYGRARVFYSCKENTIAVLTDTRGNKIKLSSTSIVNLRKRLSLQCVTLTTAPPPEEVPQTEEGGIENLEQLPDVETPSATSPPPTKIERPSPPAELPACPSIAPSSKHSFNTRNGMDPCEKKCSFRVNIKGSVQVVTRSYYTCCSEEEEPILFGAIPNYYVCPGEPDGIPEEIERPPVNRIIPPLPKVTNPPPSVIPPAELPACPSNVPSSQYSFDTRNGKVPCRVSCSFRTSVYRGAVQVRTRSYYTCCSGEAPRRSGGVYYLCP